MVPRSGERDAKPSGFSALGKIRVATGGNPELFAAGKIETCRR